MKNTLFLLIVLLAGISINAQPFGEAAVNYRIVKSEYENKSGEKGTTLFMYNPQGQLNKAIWALDNQSRNSMNYYEHDKQNHIISTFREFSDGLISFEQFLYDSIGNKTAEYFFRSDSVSGFATYQYEENRVVRAHLNKYKGWLNGTLSYFYASEQKKEKALLELDSSVICTITYYYDSNNNLLKEFWDFNGKWNQTFLYYYEKIDKQKHYYASPLLSCSGNHRILNETYTYNGEIGGPSFYYYNDNGLLNEKVFKRSDGTSTQTRYKYDSDRRLVTSTREYSNGEQTIFKYTYDENNNLIARYFYQADTLFGFESYLYNSEGELKKAYLKNFDGWLTGTISFTSDDLQKINEGEFKGENGFDAVISFRYNSLNQVEEIRWNFSFGKYQQYNFSYE